MTSGGRSVGIVSWRTQATEVYYYEYYFIIIIINYCYVALQDTHLNIENNFKVLDSMECTVANVLTCDHHPRNFIEVE
jgi:hypothetical protein